MLSDSITSHLHSCPPTARAPGWVPAAGQPPSSPSCVLKRAAGVQQLPNSSFSSEVCVNESPDTAEALVLGRAQRRLEQRQHFKCSSILGRGMWLQLAPCPWGGTWERVAPGKGGTKTVPLHPRGRWLPATAQPGSFTRSMGEMAVEGNCAPRVLGRVAQTPP